MAKRIKINLGDIFKIQTKKGYAFMQCVHSDKLEGEIIKVFYKIWDNSEQTIDDILKSDFFLVGFPLKYALKQGIVALVGNSDIGFFEKPKFMRSPHQIGEEKLGWHIIDTATMKRKLVKTLNDEQKKLSPWGIWNDTLLIENLDSGWRLEEWI
ncbi:hypothetical protein [Poritiphilus flavus]|uniref:Immunity protein 26 n=1 Tax=Poritiphilus flavus TaxID=2697053 RepID=A0A6L9EHJ4_9FLAO|nr:hypothetical protein [Poritiphilus flavus]NAS14136.1 hypothetical protein [Poritiphilus flavus]